MRKICLVATLAIALSGCEPSYEKTEPFDTSNGWTHSYGCRYSKKDCYSYATSKDGKVFVDVTIRHSEFVDATQYDLARYTSQALKQEAAKYQQNFKVNKSKYGLICFYGKSSIDYAGPPFETHQVICPDGKKTLEFFIISDRQVDALSTSLDVIDIAKSAKFPKRK